MLSVNMEKMTTHCKEHDAGYMFVTCTLQYHSLASSNVLPLTHTRALSNAMRHKHLCFYQNVTTSSGISSTNQVAGN